MREIPPIKKPLISGAILAGSTVNVINDVENDAYPQIFVASITLALIATPYYFGMRGLLLMFPLLSVYFYTFKNLSIAAVEVLLRSHGAALEGVEPGRYIKVAEECGLTYRIDLLVMDDFGRGYTPFSQLSAYSVDSLKIDRSFVTNIG